MWARSRAPLVIVRKGGESYSAERDRPADLEPWPGSDTLGWPPQLCDYRGSAWVYDDSTPPHPTGTYAARVDDGDSRSFEDAEVAIDWARGRAAVVTVVEGPPHARQRYAAGRLQAPRESLLRVRAAEDAGDVTWRVSVDGDATTVRAPDRRTAERRALERVLRGLSGPWTARVEAEPLDT